MFASRVQEGKDVRTGLESIQAKLKALQDEENDLRKNLAQVEKLHAPLSWLGSRSARRGDLLSRNDSNNSPPILRQPSSSRIDTPARHQ